MKRQIKQINYGLAFLRTILAFYVIRYHCFHDKAKKNLILNYLIIKRRNIHVPSFFIMSFYFNYKSLISRNSKINCKRFERLIIPYIFWPIIIYLLNIITSKYFKIELNYAFKSLLIQLILGRGIINPLWFQFDLIALTFLFLVIIYLFKKYYLILLQFLMIFAYFLQYSKYNEYFFLHFRNEFQNSVGRLNLMIPFAVTGFTLSSLNIIDNLKKYYKLKTIIFSTIIFIFVDNFRIFFVFSKFADYTGIKLNVLSICLIFIFSSFAFEKIKIKYITNIVDLTTRYTAGIFYLHIPVYKYSKYFFNCIRKGDFISLFLV